MSLLALTTYVPWWKWPLLMSVAYLLYQRHILFNNNVHDRYSPGEEFVICSAQQAEDNSGVCIGDAVHSIMSKKLVLNCTPSSTWPGTRARTADGTCNDLHSPAAGARFYRFSSNIRPEHLSTAPRMFDKMDPNPRLVARKFLERTSLKPVPILNSLAAAWIQMNTHDWFHHGENELGDGHVVPLAMDDPLRTGEFADGKLRVRRTRQDRTRKQPHTGPITATNNVTHWWDASPIYGSTQAIEDKIRSFEDGKLLLDDEGLLPVAFNGIEITGFNDNWWTGLSVLHTLFTKEHNTICDMLKEANPDMSDQRLFEVARLINAAVIAKIHTVELTPALLSSTPMKLGMNMNWHGFLGPNIKKFFGHTGSDVLSGLVGWRTENFGVPFSLTEEFTAIYRMHSLLRDDFDMVRVSSQGKLVDKMPLLNMTFARHVDVRKNYSQADLLLTMGTNLPGALTLHNFPRTLMDITKPSGERLELASIDILRDRERQVPRFNHYRRSMNLVPYKSIDEISPDKDVTKLLKEVYDNDVEKIDLLIGGLAETFPDNFAFSDTVFQAFIVMASRRLICDRFYTEDYTPEVYTKEGLAWIDEVDMRAVLLRHYPSLKPALDTVPRNNAFAPWSWTGAAGAPCKTDDDCESNNCLWTSWTESTCE